MNIFDELIEVMRGAPDGVVFAMTKDALAILEGRAHSLEETAAVLQIADRTPREALRMNFHHPH